MSWILTYWTLAIDIVIGFLNEKYSVSESDGTASIVFGVITESESLGTDISIQLNLSDGSARCKLLSY